MSSETIWQELELFRQKIAYFFGQFLLFARQLIRDPSIVPRGDLVLILRQLVELLDEARHLGQVLTVLVGQTRTGGVLRPGRRQGGKAEQRNERFLHLTLLFK